MKKQALLCFLLLTISFISVKSNELINDEPGGGSGFIENRGQWEQSISFYAQLPSMNLIISNNSIIYNLSKFSGELLKDPKSSETVNKSMQVLKMNFIGSNPGAKVRGEGRLPGVYNFFLGNNPNKWQKSVPNYNKIIIENLYEGINMIIYPDGEFPRYDFEIQPQANPGNVKFSFEGAEGIDISENNELNIRTRLGDIKHKSVFAYQQNMNGKKVECRFVKFGNAVSFKLGGYDKSKTLTIDPLVFSSYFGGSKDEQITGMCKISDTDFLVSGWTESLNFKTSPGAFDTVFHNNRDGFVSRFRIDGDRRELVFSTIFGASDFDQCNDIGIDGDTNIYICGFTDSPDFPVKSGVNMIYNNEYDCFIAKLNNMGNELIYSSFFGGYNIDRANAIFVTNIGEVYITGETNSTDFYTSNALQIENKGYYDTFVARVNDQGNGFRFCTYLGGMEDDMARDIFVDNYGNIYLTGKTKSPDFYQFDLQM
ncbi:MAG: hypothetical protein QG635_1487, partial [Bacteroidota bacterium]|nr:hypothetical protein [Bacteroidota bacterium]